MMRLIVIILLVCLSIDASQAQSPFFEQYFLGRRNEPIHVNKIFQSREGYLWFGTSKGLFRFDGKEYVGFSLNDSLPDLNVTAIAQDSLGRIWTGHSSGKISYFDHSRFVLFNPREGLSPSPVSDLLFDNGGVLWFSTLNDGLYYYRRERLYRLDEEDGMPDLYTYDIETANGKIYAGTDGGVAICSLNAKGAVITVLDDKNGLPDNIVRKVVVTSNSLLLGTEDKGVVIYDLVKKSFRSLTGTANLKSVSDIIVKSDRAWISSAQTGISVAEISSERVKHYADFDDKKLPMFSSLLVDAEGNIWAGSRNGIFRTLGDELEFISDPVFEADPSVMAVASSKDGALWFSTQRGLFKRMVVDGNARTIDILANTAFRSNRVISLFVDEAGFVWAGLYGEGVLRINTATNQIKLISKELRNGNVLNISGRGNVVWLATLGGAERVTVNGEKLSIQHYSVENGLSSDFIYQVYVDRKGRAWLATDGKGIDLIADNKITHLDNGLVSKVVYGIAEDSSGRIWANTQDAGIFYFDGKSFSDAVTDSAFFRETNNFVLTADRAGRIIAMHNGGIDIYDPVSKAMRYLGDKAGVENKVANLNSVTRSAEGDLLVGTTDGIISLRYDPNPPATPKIHIAGISPVGSKNTLDLSRALRYHQNNLTIHYRGFWYQDPDDVAFAYKMDNYDKDWIATRENSITYSQLPPGDYAFRVRSSVDPLTEQTIRFTIKPPFWRTAAFIVGVVLVTAGLIFAYIKYRERSLEEAKMLLEQKVEERTLEIQRNVEEIQAQNEEIMAQAEEIKGINENLEMLVQQRTAEIEKKNIALEEYAFINAHKLRSPVASILGLVNLLNKSEMNDECKVINKHLMNSADELDEIVRSITRAIERGDR